MKFVKTEDLVEGRAIARPVYNRQGVTLYNSGVKIDARLIANFKEAEIYGTYVLDHGEPAPVISEEEEELDRFQSVETYAVNDILTAVVKGNRVRGIEELTDKIYHKFGFLRNKIIFNQSLRSEKDFVSKHSLNVAMLCAMIAEKMRFDNKEKRDLIQAAIYHDLGKLMVPKKILHKKGRLTDNELQTTNECILKGYELLGKNYAFPASVRRYLIQLAREMTNSMSGYPYVEQTLLPGTKILKVADIYDTLTAIRPYKDPMSAFEALQIIREEKEKYDPAAEEALEGCLNLLPAGSYVNLSNGEQAIVIAENPNSVFAPRILSLTSNQIYDLSDKSVSKDLKIVGTVFTNDNRQKVVAEQVKNLVAKAKADVGSKS